MTANIRGDHRLTADIHVALHRESGAIVSLPAAFPEAKYYMPLGEPRLRHIGAAQRGMFNLIHNGT